MAGEIKRLKFSDGVTVSAPTTSFFTAGSFAPYVDETAYVAAKGEPAAEGDAFFNTTTDTVWYYKSGAWTQFADLNSIQDLANKTLDDLFYESADVSISSGAIAAPSAVVLRVQNSESTLNNLTGVTADSVKILVNQTGGVLNIEPQAGGAGEFYTSDPSDTLELPNNTAIKIVYDADLSSWHIAGGAGHDRVLEGRTIDGDLNTLQDLALSTLKTTANLNVFLQRDGSGDVIDSAKAVPSGDVVGTSDSQTLTGKTIDADSNTISNIDNSEIKAAAGIEMSKLETLTADRALLSSGSGVVAVSAVTNVELGHLSGVTSALQTQIDGKQDDLITTRGDIIIGDASGDAVRLAVGASGQVLSSDGTDVSWSTPAGTGDVTAAAVMADNTLVRGDGGAKGVQDSGVTLDDSDNMVVPGNVTMGSAQDSVLTVKADQGNGNPMVKILDETTGGSGTINGFFQFNAFDSTDTERNWFQIDQRQVDDSNSDTRLRHRSSGATATFMSAVANLVAIGDGTPEALLHVIGSSNPTLRLEETGTAGNGNILNQIQFYAENSVAAKVQYAEFEARSEIVTSGSERGSMRLNLAGELNATVWDANSGDVTGMIEGNTYTANATGIANNSAPTEGTHRYQRIGNVVTVTGHTTINNIVSGGGTNTTFDLTLPIAADNNLSNSDYFGTGTGHDSTTGAHEALRVVGGGNTTEVRIAFPAAATNSVECSYTFTYSINN